jgi:hypothetical protein
MTSREAAPFTMIRGAPFAILLAGIAAVACTINPAHETACYPGDFQWCLCADGTRGLQQCDTDAGSGYGACVCNAPDAGGAQDAAPEASSSCSDAGTSNLCLYSPCTSDSQCAAYQGKAAQCFQFNAKGPHCTIPCALDGDCPPPSTGCSNNKVCKEP